MQIICCILVITSASFQVYKWKFYIKKPKLFNHKLHDEAMSTYSASNKEKELTLQYQF